LQQALENRRRGEERRGEERRGEERRRGGEEERRQESKGFGTALYLAV
jgi:hypothetical protein